MARASNVRRVFLSYSHRDRSEAQQLFTELQRRGVPVWWDRVHLPRGRVTARELEKASREAAGFAFYLTEEAAESDWVREDERRHALANQRLDETFGIFPIFRAGIQRVTELMQSRAGDRSDLCAYDLSSFHGYVIEPGASGDALDEELRAAATEVLRSILGTLADRRPAGTHLRIGAATRGGPALAGHPLDLLIDWTRDFPGDQGAGDYPSSTTAEALLRALQDLRGAVLHEWPGRTVQVVAHCHLSMAFALGFLFRRNSGFGLQVVNPYTGDVWYGPEQPLAALPRFWSMEEAPSATPAADDGIAAVISVSRPIAASAEQALAHRGLRVRETVRIEPAEGPSDHSLASLNEDEAHRAVMPLVERLGQERARGIRGPIHLVYAGPAPFAVLLGQQLSNLGEIRIYEWKDADAGFVPVFVLRSS
jgi:hypothetical protein